MKQVPTITLLFLIVIAGCGSVEPTPVPTATPIPGYVGGEEDFAYGSFIEFYKTKIVDCTWDPYEPEYVRLVDVDYPGIAVYVGNGIWRFHIQTYLVDADRVVEQTYEEEVVQIRSLPDRTWEDLCTKR